MKQFILIFMSLGMSISVVACDVCGCSAGTFGMGVLPDFSLKTFGVNSLMQTYRSTHPILFTDEQPVVATDQFIGVDLFARLPIYKSLQAQVNVPFVQATQLEGQSSIKQRGLGDMALGVNYLHSGGDVITYQLSVGLGIKFPTGKWEDPSQLVASINLMPGTGSTDMNASISGIVRYRKIGLLLQSRATKNGRNEHHYQFGDRLEAIGRIMGWVNFGEDLSIIPHLGASYLSLNPNQENSQELDLTGGAIHMLRFGIDGYYKNWGLQTQLAVQISQNLSEGYVEQTQWSQVSLLFYLSRK